MLEEGNTLIQVVVGPRQTGKSTMIAQALRGLDVLAHSVSADDILAPTEEWLRDERQQARNLQRMSHSPVILVLDEVQKVKGWPNIVKGLWDADRRDFLPLKVFLSGSSSLLLRKGLEDSPKGRFELIRSPPIGATASAPRLSGSPWTTFCFSAASRGRRNFPATSVVG